MTHRLTDFTFNCIKGIFFVFFTSFFYKCIDIAIYLCIIELFQYITLLDILAQFMTYQERQRTEDEQCCG